MLGLRAQRDANGGRYALWVLQALWQEVVPEEELEWRYSVEEWRARREPDLLARGSMV